MPPAKKGYKVGETVFGLWPGSGGLFFKGVIVERDAADGTYDVKFEEGTTYTLLEKHVKPVDSFKAMEPKSAQRQVSRRRARSSSASRSRSRSRTPGRKPRTSSPVAKKSPKQEKSSPRKTSPETKKKLTEVAVDEVPVTRGRGRPRRISPTKPAPVAEVKQEEDSVSRRRSTRIAEKGPKEDSETERSPGKAKPNGKEQNESESAAATSGEDEEIQSVSAISALLTTVCYLSMVVFLYLICQHNKCLFKGIPQFKFADLLALYNPAVSISVEGFYLATFLLSLLPIGEIVSIGEGHSFRRNSIFGTFALISTLIGAKHYFKISATMIMKHIPQFIIPNFIVGFVVATLVAYKTRHQISAEAGYLSHVVIGSSPNVSLAGVHIKIWVHRAMFLSLIGLNSLALEANWERTRTITPTLGLVAAMQIIFALESLWNEENILNTYKFKSIKTGWMYFSMLAYPFMTFVITLSVVQSRVELPYYCLAPIGLLFLFGLWIKIGSNKQKDAFIKDPNHPSFAGMETLTSSSDGKLLISGWWGWLRHPNYLGDIAVHWAFALPCGFHMVLPHAVALFITICLLFRAIENDLAGKLKYGPTWDRYCQRVPSRVIPRVF